MSSIQITKWSGRFGNNCIQLSNAVYLAQELGIRHIQHPPHRMLRDQVIDLGEDLGSHAGLSGTFFYPRSLHPHVPPLPVCRRKHIFLETLWPELTLRRTIEPRREDFLKDHSTLVIHVRSGDVFGANPHPGYVQPPLWYYRTIIESFAWNNILLVSEDTRNPVINRLRTDYPIIHWQPSTLREDLSVLFNARNLVGSHGTFTLAAFCFNADIRRYWIPGTMKKPSADLALAFPEQVIIIQCPGYIKAGDWKNSPEQRKMMFDYQPQPEK